MHDLKNLLNGANGQVSSVLPLLRTASVNGSSADLQEYEGAVIAVHCGTVTDGTFTVTIEESDDNSSFSTVAAADLDGDALQAYTSSNEEKPNVHHYRGTARYIRVVITASGSPATGSTISALVLRHNPRRFNAI